MLLPWDYIYVASRGAQIETYIVDNFVYGYKMTMCAISTKKCTYAGGGGVNYVYLQNKYGREDVENCSQGLSFNRFIILLKPSAFPFLISWWASLPN